ncbi:YdeI/OmpD-associated family protein [Pedobacter sp. NJ-S-72]
METNNCIPAFYASTRKDWRNWLEKNSQHKESVCLIIYHKKKNTTPSVYYSEAIEEALCFGWIDGKAKQTG